MSLDVKEFNGSAPRSGVPLQPPIGGATGMTAGGVSTYTTAGPGYTFVELYANGASHTFTVSGEQPSTLSQNIASGQRLVYGFAPGSVITVTV